MATARQIAANQRNARKSTGPKSLLGKQRASRNAYRHGLSIADPVKDFDTVESLARRIAGSSSEENTLYYAKIAARAHLNLARIRQVKIDIIERAHRFASREPTPHFRSSSAEVRYLKNLPFDQAVIRWLRSIDGSSGPMLLDGPDRTAEAVKRMLPELGKLYRYERRAINTRDSALRAISSKLRQ